MTNSPNPAEGQFFTLHPVPPPKPKANTHWGLPLALGLLAIPLLMFGFGFSQQQQPTPSVSPSATPSVEFSPTPDVTPPTPTPPETTATQPLESTAAALSFTPRNDGVTLPIARVRCPGRAANFRAAPSLHSQILGVLQDGDLVELTTDQRVQQDGVTWLPVRFRGQSGWLASNFIHHRRDYAAQP